MIFVDRRTIYTWFDREFIKREVLYKIGSVINHDFSIEFPEHFKKEDFNITTEDTRLLTDNNFWKTPDTILWKDKYMQLLEKHNILLALKLTPEVEGK